MSRERGNVDSFGGQRVNVTETADPDDPTHWRQVACSSQIFCFPTYTARNMNETWRGKTRSKQKQGEPA
jgi:hypothetical protein